MSFGEVPELQLGGRSTSVVICCYSDERWFVLLEAIASALAQRPAADEVLVVVDHNPGLAARLRAEPFSGLRIVENTHQRGLSGARNTAIDATSGAIILFLDDDAAADPDLLAVLARRTAEPGVMGAVSAIRPRWERNHPRWFPSEFFWTLGCTYEGMRAGPVRNLIGAAMCMRRTVFQAVGGFDTGLGRTHASLPLGCEETEFCIRAGQAFRTGRFVFDPSTGCDHAIPPRRANWRYFLYRCYAEGLSKASLSTIVGADQALTTERSYVRRTLPRGVLLGLIDAARGRPVGILRAAAIVAGFSVTAAGFCLGRVRLARRSRSRSLDKASAPATGPAR